MNGPFDAGTLREAYRSADWAAGPLEPLADPGPGHGDGAVHRRPGGAPRRLAGRGLTELTEALRDRQQLTAEELCDHLLAHFGADTEDDIVLTVIRADPH